MVQLLDRLALEKIRDGDEEGARQVVTEKASTKDVLERTNARAQVNYQLASKLADKIGRVQLQLVQMLAPGDAPRPSAAPAAAPPPAAAAPGPSAPQQPAGTEPQYAPRKPDWEASLEAARARLAAAEAAAPAASSAAAPAPSAPRQPAAPASGGYGGGAAAPQYAARKPDWEASLEAARARLAAAEAAAASEGRRPAWQPRESLEEARERLRAQAVSGVVEAQQRMRSRASESISEARARIAAEDEAVLAKVQALMARYRRGEYVSEDELEWAFRQLEKRFVV
ncbi:MAG: hypothetical protein J3K34DRAFT_136984 [Monoraphidium minutum]|nr:MAG: hypothetical protein J3K34DRAFT_136984 [Monoraphidium minutum]